MPNAMLRPSVAHMKKHALFKDMYVRSPSSNDKSGLWLLRIVVIGTRFHDKKFNLQHHFRVSHDNPLKSVHPLLDCNSYSPPLYWYSFLLASWPKVAEITWSCICFFNPSISRCTLHSLYRKSSWTVFQGLFCVVHKIFLSVWSMCMYYHRLF